MKILHHNSIVKILETLETPNYILIIMENISGGDLLNFVKKRTKLNEKISKFIFKQLITSIKYIHSKNIIHRDIKLDNILIDLNNNIKICDFGVGKQYIKGDKLKDKCGTPAYIAPEILKNFGYEGPPVDIWSSGVVLYAMLSGTVPFKANQLKDLHKMILKGNYKKINGISSNAQDLIDKLLEVDPKKRISIEGIFKHPWMNDKNILDNKIFDEGNSNINNIDEGKIKLFTKAEIVLLSKEKIDYRNCEKNEMLENFTLKNLYTINDEVNKDIRTKSVILAPFNSTIQNNEEREKFLLENNNDLNIRNDVFLFSENTKVLNRQYELNNNGEIDHGILIKFNSSKMKEKNNKNENNSNIENEVINENKSEEFDKINNNNLENNDYSKKDSKRNISSLTDSSTIDENILKTMENFGYKRDDIQKFLINNEFNYATATYFLLSNSNDLS
jgi:serine/threonine protein kinase